MPSKPSLSWQARAPLSSEAHVARCRRRRAAVRLCRLQPARKLARGQRLSIGNGRGQLVTRMICNGLYFRRLEQRRRRRRFHCSSRIPPWRDGKRARPGGAEQAIRTVSRRASSSRPCQSKCRFRADRHARGDTSVAIHEHARWCALDAETLADTEVLIEQHRRTEAERLVVCSATGGNHEQCRRPDIDL